MVAGLIKIILLVEVVALVILIIKGLKLDGKSIRSPLDRKNSIR